LYFKKRGIQTAGPKRRECQIFTSRPPSCMCVCVCVSGSVHVCACLCVGVRVSVDLFILQELSALKSIFTVDLALRKNVNSSVKNQE